MTQDEINKAEWQDPANWRAGWLSVYVGKRDTRILVPKRNPRMGFTVNLGHRAGVVILWVTVAAIVGALVFAYVTEA